MKISERELVEQIVEKIPKKEKFLLRGAGDDCAVISRDRKASWLVTTDALYDGVHFDLSYTSLRLLGRKALSVNLSDIAAMGGAPRFYLVSIGIPSDFEDVQTLYRGMFDVAQEYGVTLIGGDTCLSKSGLVITITAIGEAKNDEIIFRSVAKAGDYICVGGEIGSAALGLKMLKRKFRASCFQPPASFYIRAHLSPSPQIELGRRLAKSGSVSSMIDISDGLLIDLDRIAEASKAGYAIETSKIPRAKSFDKIAVSMGFSPEELLLMGGEDYKLLYTVRERCWKKSYLPVCIGRMSNPGTKRVIGPNDKEMKFKKMGFDHFK